MRLWRGVSLAALGLVIGCGARSAAPPRGANELIDVQTVVPSIRLDLRYATPNNFTGRALYPTARCLLRPEVAQRLGRAQAALQPLGLGLKVYDCYRPLFVQRELWAVKPDTRYVADPAAGSRHNRAAAVDVTLVRSDGSAIGMPTDFDDFSPRASRAFDDLPPSIRLNRALLQQVMIDAGFMPLPSEWWHFDAPDWQQYEVLDVPFE